MTSVSSSTGVGAFIPDTDASVGCFNNDFAVVRVFCLLKVSWQVERVLAACF